jgi:triacylglycerol esterase/lipase EstA (alpha/beta hydrolase family)
MTAFILMLALVLGTGWYVQWAAHWVGKGAAVWWFVVGAPVAYFTPAIVLVTLWFAVSWIWRTPRPPEARLDFKTTLHLYWTELWVVALSWPLMALNGLLNRDPPPAPAKRPILLIHGVLVNDGVWVAFRRYLRRRGIAPIYTINYGPPLADIELFAEQLDRRIEAIRKATGAERLVLVSHSMGGLVARAYLRRFGGARVARLITLGTPHHGSVLAYMFPGRDLVQMHPGNPWLHQLNGDEKAPPPAPIASIWSRHDSMVAPQASSVLGNAENIALNGVAHNALLADPEVRRCVVQEIGKVPADSPSER